ncbi:MAG: hypothetical protein HYR72_11595 [Deltaproteobacteria bacterium]|nr:hypothetical protein [Deltaproteobacteria bacterium]MBI3387607.1 hypothetical protein [Deltaproteobacteria bacterium]
MDLSPKEIKRLYAAIRSEFSDLPIQNARNIAAAAGIDMTRLPVGQAAQKRAAVLPAIDLAFGELDAKAQVTALCILAERVVKQNPEIAARVQEVLSRHGFQFLDGTFVPVALLDARESHYLPPSSASEIAKATARLVDGDESGAITAACGAVDLATQSAYHSLDLGDPGKVSFSAKVNTAFKRLCVFDDMEQAFVELGMSESDASSVVEDVRCATNRAAQALQTLRRSMGDVHGSKPALRSTAYDAIKWASAICALLDGKI